jgi:hypothetical protein
MASNKFYLMYSKIKRNYFVPVGMVLFKVITADVCTITAQTQILNKKKGLYKYKFYFFTYRAPQSKHVFSASVLIVSSIA